MTGQSREAAESTMKVRVDMAICQLHGQCVYSAPDVFRIEGDDLMVDERPDAAQRGLVQEAVEACPEQAISIED